MLCYLTEVVENQWLCKCSNFLLNLALTAARFEDVKSGHIQLQADFVKIEIWYVTSLADVLFDDILVLRCQQGFIWHFSSLADAASCFSLLDDDYLLWQQLRFRTFRLPMAMSVVNCRYQSTWYFRDCSPARRWQQATLK